VGDSTAEVRAKIADADLHIALLVDGDGKPLGWLSERALSGERVVRDLRSPAEPIVELDDILRDALSDLLERETQYAPVVNPRGGVVGVLSIEVISHVLNTPPQDLPSAAELVAEEE
jgi:osmoprotectant transport system ATP-binding protein